MIVFESDSDENYIGEIIEYEQDVELLRAGKIVTY